MLNTISVFSLHRFHKISSYKSISIIMKILWYLWMKRRGESCLVPLAWRHGKPGCIHSRWNCSRCPSRTLSCSLIRWSSPMRRWSDRSARWSVQWLQGGFRQMTYNIILNHTSVVLHIYHVWYTLNAITKKQQLVNAFNIRPFDTLYQSCKKNTVNLFIRRVYQKRTKKKIEKYSRLDVGNIKYELNVMMLSVLSESYSGREYSQWIMNKNDFCLSRRLSITTPSLLIWMFII